MATKDDVRDRAAQELGRLRIGQSLQNQDKVRIETAYTEVYEDLKDEGLAIWASDADIPNEVVPHVVFLVADNCVGTYGVSDQRYQRIKLGEAKAKREIRRLVTPPNESIKEPDDF